MPVELSIEGAGKLDAVAKALNTWGRGNLKKELYSGLNRATKPLRRAAKVEAVRILPRGGGLNMRAAKTRLSTRRGTSRNPGVRIIAATNELRDPLSLDRGRIKHPTFGHRPYVIQQVSSGWFTKPMEDGAPYVRVELIKVLDSVATKIAFAQKAAPVKSRKSRPKPKK